MRLHYHTNCSYRVLTEYSDFKSQSKMSQEQGAIAVIIALISEKNKPNEKRKKEESVLNLGLKEEKTKDLMKLCLQNCG